jgi:hypothetical protein
LLTTDPPDVENTLYIKNGFIKIIKSSNEPSVILAQGDIGGNVITDIN